MASDAPPAAAPAAAPAGPPAPYNFQRCTFNMGDGQHFSTLNVKDVTFDKKKVAAAVNDEEDETASEEEGNSNDASQGADEVYVSNETDAKEKEELSKKQKKHIDAGVRIFGSIDESCYELDVETFENNLKKYVFGYYAVEDLKEYKENYELYVAENGSDRLRKISFKKVYDGIYNRFDDLCKQELSRLSQTDNNSSAREYIVGKYNIFKQRVNRSHSDVIESIEVNKNL